MATVDDLNRIFEIVDSDGSGYLDKEKLRRICPQLSTTEIDAIFDDLDADQDQRISLKEFTEGFQENRQTTEKLVAQNVLLNGEDHLETSMTPAQLNEIFTSLSCQEQIYDFYETLQQKSSESIEQFHSILEIFVSDIMKYRKEIKRLEDSYRREKEMNEKFLKRLEEDQEREMRQLEEKIRKQEKSKFESERESIQQRAAKQMADLQANVHRLQLIEQSFLDHQSNEDSLVAVLREEISKLTQENQSLTSSYNDSLTTITILKSDLQSIKSQLNERQNMLIQEKQNSAQNQREKESLQSNIRQLVQVNKNLRDENDSLRATIESQRTKSIVSDIAIGSKRNLSRAGSILEHYWDQNQIFKAENVDSSTENQFHSRIIESIELESPDELGIHDSGLSLTTVRDLTEEIESDRELKQISSMTLTNSKPFRPLPVKRNNQESDSDEVFDENCSNRTNSKRWSQQRSIKRTAQNSRLSSKSSFQPVALRNPSESNVQTDSSILNLPFDRMYKVVFCGDAAVGKSTLIMRLCKNKFVSNINSTLGVDFQNKQLELDGKRIAIQLWDTAGQERFRSIAKSYFRRCDGVILVYDTTYERSFLNVRDWMEMINDSTSKKVSVMIVANKVDLRDQYRREGKRIVEHDDGAKLAKESGALFIETSAKEGTNAAEALIELARDMQCNEDLERYRTAGIDLDKTSKKTMCCGGRS